MSHLTCEQRYAIEIMIAEGISKPMIASRLKVNKSTIYRELKRNSDQRNGLYYSKLAQRKYVDRLTKKVKAVKFKGELKKEVETLIKDDYSPEQISGVLSKQGKFTISHERIYQHIWNDKRNKGELHLHLRHKGRKYRKRGNQKDSRGVLVGRIGIEKRPKEADERSEFGHLEVDTIIGKNHKGAIITLNDRACGMLWMKKVESRDAKLVRQKVCEMLDEIRPYIKSITADNGKEFAEHQYITDEYCNCYFANPYSPWERGSKENLNGLIRQYIPKSSSFENISDQRIKEIQNKINSRPRKRYNYENPILQMEKLLFNSEVAFVS